jgi:hypothetical protein
MAEKSANRLDLNTEQPAQGPGRAGLRQSCMH